MLLPAGAKIRGISAGTNSELAVTTTGGVYGWGVNNDGELGVPLSTFELKPVLAGLPAGAAATEVRQAGNASLALTDLAPIPASKALSLPSAKRCVSRRKFTIHIRKLPGITWDSAVVRVRGKRVKTIKRPRLGAFINLTGLPKGTFKVSITATTTDGRTVTGTRTYHTCAPRRGSSGPPKL